jgi:hypothetical protein
LRVAGFPFFIQNGQCCFFTGMLLRWHHRDVDYARQPHTLELSEDGAVFRAESLELTVHWAGWRDTSLQAAGITVERRGDGVRLTRVLREGQSGGIVLESMGGPARRVTSEEVDRLRIETVRFWRTWLDGSTYRGRWREMVARSAMTLKLMTYAPTGGLVAAPTAGLPEQVGGERNWDYRYTWIRDGSFSVYALLGLGFTEEAAAFTGWLRDRVSQASADDSAPLKIMYRVDGSSDLTEQTLDHLQGWRGSRPVRIGNGAAGQLQLDIYGEAMDAFLLADTRGVALTHQGWIELAGFIDWLCEHWDQPRVAPLRAALNSVPAEDKRLPTLVRYFVEGIGDGARGISYRLEGWLGRQRLRAGRSAGTRRARDPPQGRAHLADACIRGGLPGGGHRGGGDGIEQPLQRGHRRLPGHGPLPGPLRLGHGSLELGLQGGELHTDAVVRCCAPGALADRLVSTQAPSVAGPR